MQGVSSGPQRSGVIDAQQPGALAWLVAAGVDG